MSAPAVEVLPLAVRKLVEDNVDGINPGLRLDKYARAGKMDQQQQELRDLKLNESPADAQVLRAALLRRNGVLPEGFTWQRTTSDSLTLHLSRASVLENTSLCLHPVYGFPYLPGTGLKGLARAWAETVWSQSQPDRHAAWDRIHAVFGAGDKTDEDKPWMPTGFGKPEEDRAGGVVFHDAWPIEPPKLQLDFLTPHHKGYYECAAAPGDWEDPEPASFLSIPSGTEFTFAIAPAAHCTDRTLVEDARRWLDDALTVFGAGAKTNAGYGVFRPVSGEFPVLSERFVTSTHKLTLITPAFFAGDQEDPRSCRLRGGTLRGLLRWWWRTMHAGFLSPTQLLQLEREIWGGTAGNEEGQASVVQIRIEQTAGADPRLFDRDELKTALKLEWPKNGEKKTPGLTFLSYGMNEKNNRKRYYLPAGATWNVTLTARVSARLSAEEAVREARNALWLLTSFSGLGAKSRKAFGCLALDNDNHAPENVTAAVKSIRREAKELRARLGYQEEFQTEHAVPGSWNLEGRVPGTPSEVNLGVTVAGEQGLWAAIHRLGTAIREFSSENKRRPYKRALGTPRNVGQNDRERFEAFNWERRHTSPVHYYLFRRDNSYWVRITAFPSPRLPDLQFSRTYLETFVKALTGQINGLSTKAAVTGSASPLRSARPTGPTPSQTGGFTPRSVVTGILMEERTKKGGWKALVQGVTGPLQKPQLVPATAKPGDQVRLIVMIGPPNAAFDFVELLEKQ